MAADPTITLNRKITEPSLADLLKLHKKDILLSLNCHGIATVQSFDSATQTITATMNYKKSYLRMDTDGVYKMQLVNYPVLLDVPVLILGGGPAQITFPIAQGDECLILFNDRDIDNWFQNGKLTAVASGRLHSFSDAIAFVGLNSAPNVISAYDMTRAVLAWGTTLVGVSSSKVKIANNLHTLNALLQELVSDVNDLVTATSAITVLCASPGSPSGPPVNAAAIAAVGSELSATATKIAELLE